MPGVGLANGGAPYIIPIDSVPPGLRTPNARLWVTLRVDENGATVTDIGPRCAGERAGR
ncbi:MAG TPA: hypothetical protein VFF65_12140 [Phycisphaerales bacterium]|nr:hypothetical protein [Phycisphaerales bacterium]